MCIVSVGCIIHGAGMLEACASRSPPVLMTVVSQSGARTCVDPLYLIFETIANLSVQRVQDEQVGAEEAWSGNHRPTHWGAVVSFICTSCVFWYGVVCMCVFDVRLVVQEVLPECFGFVNVMYGLSSCKL